MNNDELKMLISVSINCIIDDFQNNAFTFMYERDIQCALFSKMRCLITDTIDFYDKINKIKYKINMVYSEYGSRIDLVCLDKEKIDLKDVKFLNQDVPDIYSLDTLVGIELKYITRGYYNKSVNVSFDDYDKLCKLENVLVENKLALCFVQEGKDANNILSDAEKYYNCIDIEEIKKLEGVYLITSDKIYGVTKK